MCYASLTTFYHNITHNTRFDNNMIKQSKLTIPSMDWTHFNCIKLCLWKLNKVLSKKRHQSLTAEVKLLSRGSAGVNSYSVYELYINLKLILQRRPWHELELDPNLNKSRQLFICLLFQATIVIQRLSKIYTDWSGMLGAADFQDSYGQ